MVDVGIIGSVRSDRKSSGIAAGRAGDARVVAALVRNVDRVPDDIKSSVRVTADIAEFLAIPSSVVVEAGGHGALQAHGAAVLASGRDLMTISVGAFADSELLEGIRAAAESSGQRVLVPSGAIAGIDAIAAASLGGLDSVTHTTRKPVAAFTAEQLAGPVPDEPRLLFDGPAKEGVLLYPENVNVAASVSLAGIGLERTRLRVYADPTVTRNRHEVVVEGYFGRLRIEIENIPTEHAKTGRIVALSMLKAIRDLTAPIVMGR